METTNPNTQNAGRRAAFSALAIVGFIILILIGIALAIYTARNFPKIGSKLNGAAVSLSSVFHSNDPQPALEVVTASSSLPFGSTSTTTSTTTFPIEVPGAASSTASAPSHPSHVTGQTSTYTVVTTQQVAPYGNPDLSVNVTDVGFLSRGSDTSSFVGSNNAPYGNNAAVKFTVTNVGTNVSAPWNFSADIPTSPSQHFVSPDQAPLKPGDSVDFVLGFDRGYSAGQRITVTVVADPSNRMIETTKNNNVSSRWINIQ